MCISIQICVFGWISTLLLGYIIVIISIFSFELPLTRNAMAHLANPPSLSRRYESKTGSIKWPKTTRRATGAGIVTRIRASQSKPRELSRRLRASASRLLKEKEREELCRIALCFVVESEVTGKWFV